MISCCIFDLDGVIVDTARYHFLAWKRLAVELQIEFSEEDNELLKGVSRIESLNTILRLGNKTLTEDEFNKSLKRKNDWYLDYIYNLKESEILPGAKEFIDNVRTRGIKTALGSASKNAQIILERLHLLDSFDAIIDGTKVSKAKPDPEVFLKGAEKLKIAPEECIVFEDAAAGVEAALNAGMRVVGIGSPEVLSKSHVVVPNLEGLTLDDLTE